MHIAAEDLVILATLSLLIFPSPLDLIKFSFVPLLREMDLKAVLIFLFWLKQLACNQNGHFMSHLELF